MCYRVNRNTFCVKIACKKTDSGKMCPLCKVTIQYVEINNAMDQTGKDYFDIQLRFKSTEHLLRVGAFQRSQIQNFLKASNAMQEKYEAAIEEYHAKEEEKKKLNEKLEKCCKYQQQLEQRLRQMNAMRAKAQNESSGYGSMNMSSKSDTSFLNAPSSKQVTNVFVTPAKPTSNLFNIGPGSSTGTRPTNTLGRNPLIHGQASRPKPLFGELTTPFHSQKASTPTDASRKKVLTQEFSFQSTPSTTGRYTRR